MSRLAGFYPTRTDGGLGILGASGDGVRALVGVSAAGVVNQVYSFENADEALAALGGGPLARAAADHLSLGGGIVHAVPAAIATASIITADSGNPVAPAVALANTAIRDAYEVIIKITRAGALGVGAFQVSLDGGDSWGLETSLSANYAIPGTGIGVTFAAGAYVLNALYKFAVSEPKASIAGAQAAVRAALNSGRVFEYVQLVGASDAAMWAALDALVLEAESAFKQIYAVAEAAAPGADPAAWANGLIADKAAFGSVRVQIIANWAEVADTISGRLQIQSLASRIMARVSKLPVHQKAAWRKLGVIPGIVAVAPFTVDAQGRKVSLWTNGLAKSLDDAGFTTVVTMEGRQGWFVEEDRMSGPLTSDYTIAPNVRVINKAIRLVRDGMLDDTQGDLDPLELEASTQSLIARGMAPLRQMQRDGEIVRPRIILIPGQNILSSQKLRFKVRLVPKGYSKEIEADFGLENPLLQA
jgi:hypothetical protein